MVELCRQQYLGGQNYGKKRIQKKLYKGCKANDLLILNDIYLPIGENRYKHIDTIIFGNKYIYITKELNQIGDVKVSLNDNKWRVINNGSLTLIDNPFFKLFICSTNKSIS